MRSKNFLLDLAALLPLDLLQLKLGTQPLLRFPRFFKVSCFILKRFLNINCFFLCWQVYRSVKFYYIVESRTVWPNLWRVVNLIHILLILAHWFGCFYFLLSQAEGFQVYKLIIYISFNKYLIISINWQINREIGFIRIDPVIMQR